MKVIYKKEKSIIEQIDEAIVNASMYNKKIDKIVLTKEEFERVGNQLFSVDDYTYAYKNIVIELDEDEREDISEGSVDEEYTESLLRLYGMLGLLPPKESK